MKTPLQKILTSKTRADILTLLIKTQKPMYIKEFMDAFGTCVTHGVSKELKMLESIKVLHREYVGSRQYYSFADTNEARAVQNFISNF